jgi:acetoin utilization deacetylase AcuC-like enzyme
MALHVRALATELGVPFGAVLEGGYDLSALAESVAATLEGFAEDGGEPPSFAPDELTYAAAAQVGRYWELELPSPSAG